MQTAAEWAIAEHLPVSPGKEQDMLSREPRIFVTYIRAWELWVMGIRGEFGLFHFCRTSMGTMSCSMFWNTDSPVIEQQLFISWEARWQTSHTTSMPGEKERWYRCRHSSLADQVSSSTNRTALLSLWSMSYMDSLKSGFLDCNIILLFHGDIL